MSKQAKTPDACPHCGHRLSPWEQVLLGVDRLLMCRNCWYRIILDMRYEDDKKNEKSDDDHTKPKDTI